MSQNLPRHCSEVTFSEGRTLKQSLDLWNLHHLLRYLLCTRDGELMVQSMEVTWPRGSHPFCRPPLPLSIYKSRSQSNKACDPTPLKPAFDSSTFPCYCILLLSTFRGSKMAASATLHSYMAGLMPRVGLRSHSTGLRSPYLLPCQRPMRIRCQAEDQPQEQSVPVTPPPQRAQTPAPKPKAKESTKFSDLLAFSGPAPERINGRLAMVGFASALAVELARGNDLAAQLMDGGLPWFAGTAALLSVASLVPLFKGVSAQSRSVGPMTADAELWNGRFAMLGLVALAFTEYLKGGPLV